MRGKVAKQFRKLAKSFNETEANYVYIDPAKVTSHERQVWPIKTTCVLRNCWKADYRFIKRVYKQVGQAKRKQRAS